MAKIKFPACRSTKIYGYPAYEAFEAAERGEIVLGGCCITGNDPERACRYFGHWVQG